MKMEHVSTAGNSARAGREKLEAMLSAPEGQRAQLWDEALEYLAQAYNALLSGAARKHPEWQKDLRDTRLTDDLLRYLKEGRDAKAHGWGHSAEERWKEVGRGPAPDNLPISWAKIQLVTRRGERVTQEMNFGEGQEMISLAYDGLKLFPVKPRGRLNKKELGSKEIYDVPTSHLGVPLPDQEPLTLGCLAFDYIEAKIKEAFHMYEEDD